MCNIIAHAPYKNNFENYNSDTEKEKDRLSQKINSIEGERGGMGARSRYTGKEAATDSCRGAGGCWSFLVQEGLGFGV
jgi:hypothetical protein